MSMFEATHIIFILCVAFAAICLGVIGYGFYRHRRLQAMHDELVGMDLGMPGIRWGRTGRKVLGRPVLWDIYLGKDTEKVVSRTGGGVSKGKQRYNTGSGETDVPMHAQGTWATILVCTYSVRVLRRLN
jgi:hypothetical protein